MHLRVPASALVGFSYLTVASGAPARADTLLTLIAGQERHTIHVPVNRPAYTVFGQARVSISAQPDAQGRVRVHVEAPTTPETGSFLGNSTSVDLLLTANEGQPIALVDDDDRAMQVMYTR